MATMRCRSVVGAAGASAWGWSGVLAAILLIGGCGGGLATAPAPSGPAVSEWKLPHGGYLRQQRVATFLGPAEVLISDDLAHVAVIDQRGRKQRIAVDGNEGPEYDKATFLEHDGPSFGPDGMPVLYAGADEGRWRLVTNGRPGPECDAWLDQTPCGPDRTGIAYTAVEIARKAFVAVDGRAGPVYDDVSCPVLSADRKRIAYVACRGGGLGRKQIPVIDGREGPEYDQIALPSSAIWNVFSPDSGHTAYAARLGPKWRVMIDGRAGAEHDQIAPDSLAFSPDGRRVAYAARSGPKWRVVLDGQRGPEYDQIGEGPILFLSDANRIAYTALAGTKWLVVSGDQPGPGWDEIADLTLSSGGRHMVCAARQGAKWRAVVDGEAGPEYDQIGLADHGRFWVSRDGGRVAYAARLGSKWHVVVDGLAGPACDEVRQDWAISLFSSDGKHTAYTARSGAKWSVVIDGQPGLSCDEIAQGSFEFSDDGARTAYAARRGGKWLMVIDGRPGPEYDQVDATSQVFTARGTRAAYTARRGDKWRVVVNGKEGPEYEDVSELLYSPDGRRMAYVATGTQFMQQVVLDGQAGPWCDLVGSSLPPRCARGHHTTSPEWRGYGPLAGGKFALGHDNMYHVAFSADGEHVAYTARDENTVRVFRDGKAGPEYAAVGAPMFSPDGNRMAYAATAGKREEGKPCVVIDGQSGPAYDQVDLPRSPGLSYFTPDGNHTVYAARKGAKWFAVVDGKEGPACDAFFGPQSVTSYGRAAAYASWRSVAWRGEASCRYAPDYGKVDFRPLFFGADGARVAYVAIVQTRASAAVVADGQPGPQYEQVSKPVVSPDGRRVGYIACRDKGQERKFLAVIDGREGPECDEIPLGGGREWAPFSPDSMRTAYMARTGRKWRVFVDGQPGPEYDLIHPASVGSWGGFFSPDGKRVAYFGRWDAKWRAVIDGLEGPEFDQIAGDFMPLVFSPDSKRVAYVATWGQGPGGKFRAVIDGQLGPEYDAGWVAGVKFSPDSRRTAYVGKRGEEQFVVLDGKELASHDAVDGIRIQFSPDNRRLAYIAYRGKKDDRKAHFVVDGQEGPERGDSIYHFYFSPDSRHVAYIAILGRWGDRDRQEQMIVDGQEGPAVGRIREDYVRWSADSRHLAYMGKAANEAYAGEMVILDGRPGPEYAWVVGLDFTPDGNHLAYVAYKDWQAGKHLVVRDGQPGGEFHTIEMFGRWPHYNLFTPDGRHVVFQAEQDGKHSVVLDDQPGRDYDSVLCTWFRMEIVNGRPHELRSMGTPRLLPGGAVQYPAFNGGKPGELYIVTQWPSADPAPTAPR